MVFYSWEHGAAVEKNSLWEALKLSAECCRAVSLTGGGGKTSAMFRLADELADMGKSVIVTTTTHIFYPADRNVLETDCAKDVKEWFKKRCLWPCEAEESHDNGGSDGKKGQILVVGRPAAEGKLKSLPLEEAAALKGLADVLLIEADGAKRLPIKVPGEREPVILPCTDVVIGCMGLDCIGGELEKVCFRKEQAAVLLNVRPDKTGRYSHRISCRDAAVILTDISGTRKMAEDIDYRIMINKADDERLLETARKVASEAEKRFSAPCAITSFR